MRWNMADGIYVRVCTYAQTVSSAGKLQNALNDVADALKGIWQAKKDEEGQCADSQKPGADTCVLMQEKCKRQDTGWRMDVSIQGVSHNAYHKDDHAYHKDDHAYHKDDHAYHKDDHAYHKDDHAYHKDDHASSHLTLPDVSWEPVSYQVRACTTVQYLGKDVFPAHHPDVVLRAGDDLASTSMPLTNQDALHVEHSALGACSRKVSPHRPSIMEPGEGMSCTVACKSDSACALGKRQSFCSAVVNKEMETQGMQVLGQHVERLNSTVVYKEPIQTIHVTHTCETGGTGRIIQASHESITCRFCEKMARATSESSSADPDLAENQSHSIRRTSLLLTGSTCDVADVHISCTPVTLPADYREMVDVRRHDTSQHAQRHACHVCGAADCDDMRDREATQQMNNIRLAQTIDCRTGMALNSGTLQSGDEVILAASSDLETWRIAAHVASTYTDAEMSELSSENYAHTEEVKWGAYQEDACINPQAKRDDSQQLSAKSGVPQHHVVTKLRRNQATTRNTEGCLWQPSDACDRSVRASSVASIDTQLVALLKFLDACSKFIEK
jgi:hypothetical protein